MGSLMVGPIISGSMAQAVGWRNFWWFNTALIGLSIIMVIFMFPETKWHRLHPNEIIARRAANIDSKVSPTPSQEKVEVDEKLTPTATHGTMPDLSPQETAMRDPYLGKGTPSKAQWGLYTPCPNALKVIALDLWTPWRLFIYPIVEFSAFVLSWSCSSFLTLNLTQSLNFAEPPYNFAPQMVGFLNFAILAGAMIGLATAGPFSDWVSARATKKNRGIREPEMRLPAMSEFPPIRLRTRLLKVLTCHREVPYVLIMIIGNFVVAFGFQHKWPWEAIGMYSIIPILNCTYADKSQSLLASRALVSKSRLSPQWSRPTLSTATSLSRAPSWSPSP